MLRWDNVTEQEVFDMTVKMYRDPFIANKTTTSLFRDLELDHYAYLYLGSELFMYKILDVNWESYMEARGDVFKIDKIIIPIQQDNTRTIL